MKRGPKIYGGLYFYKNIGGMDIYSHVWELIHLGKARITHVWYESRYSIVLNVNVDEDIEICYDLEPVRLSEKGDIILKPVKVMNFVMKYIPTSSTNSVCDFEWKSVRYDKRTSKSFNVDKEIKALIKANRSNNICANALQISNLTLDDVELCSTYYYKEGVKGNPPELMDAVFKWLRYVISINAGINEYRYDFYVFSSIIECINSIDENAKSRINFFGPEI